MIKFRCGSCNQKLGVPDEYAGKRVRCNKCNQPAVVPKPEPKEVSFEAQSPGRIELEDRVPEAAEADFLSGLGGLVDAETDSREEAIRAAARDHSVKATVAVAGGGEGTKEAKERPAGGRGSERRSLAEVIPSGLRLPVAIAVSACANG